MNGPPMRKICVGTYAYADTADKLVPVLVWSEDEIAFTQLVAKHPDSAAAKTCAHLA